MKYFLDSAKIDEIRYARTHWGIDGVTTNPRHILESGKPFNAVLRELASEFNGVVFPVSVEINPYLEGWEEMETEAMRIAPLSENFVIKLPCTEQGLIAARSLTEKGVRTNITLVFSPSQALAAARTGSEFVSPFVGWKESNGEECGRFISDVAAMYRNYGYRSQIIVAALRNGRQIVEAATAGAHVVTAGIQVYKDSYYHPFTDYGLKRFKDAWDKTERGE
ncbi:MAG: transaldolase [Spirochaetes bacterium]|nr:transaldolase [Spirochaetota bacterium]